MQPKAREHPTSQKLLCLDILNTLVFLDTVSNISPIFTLIGKSSLFKPYLISQLRFRSRFLTTSEINIPLGRQIRELHAQMLSVPIWL